MKKEEKVEKKYWRTEVIIPDKSEEEFTVTAEDIDKLKPKS